MNLAKICAYRLPDGARIEECVQKNGISLWAVRQWSECLNGSGEWEDEPNPSSRDDTFFARCRFFNVETAYETWHKKFLAN
jgi:hypothetical protein